MISVLVCACAGQLTNVTFLSLHPSSQVLRFGFEPGGEFRLDFESSKPGLVRGFFLSEAELPRPPFSSAGFGSACSRPDVHIGVINFTGPTADGKVVWMGKVDQRSIYTLFFWNCDSNRTNFNLKAVFANPSTRLDTRDIILPRLYSTFCRIYAAMAVIWSVNTLCFLQFRVPLHTIFMGLPIIRSVSLSISGSLWRDAAVSDEPFRWKIYTISLLEFAFYTFTLAAISYVCAGFCIYRQKFHMRDRIELSMSAMLVTGSILSVQFISDIQTAFFLLGLICFSILWYLKQGVMSIVMVTGLMRQMESEPQVVAKVTLSRNFVVRSCLIVFLTLLSSSVAVGLDFHNWICATILEAGMILNTIMQLKYFLLRKKYVGDAADSVERRKRMVRRPAVIVDPVRSALVILSP
jgi:hypothetical protein